MTEHDRSTAGHTAIKQYEIRVKGHLGPRWTAWFDGLSLTTEDGGITVIRGPVVDQAALHGLLHKLRDIGVPLISLIELASHDSSAYSERKLICPAPLAPR